jgi:CBS domain-containing protein
VRAGTIADVLVRDVMNVSPTSIAARSTMREAAELVSRSAASDLAVVDDDGRFVGVLAEGDLIRAALPKFDEIVSSGGSIGEAFEMFMLNGKDLAGQPIDRIVIREPIEVHPNDDLMKVAVVMVSRHIRRLHVVEGGKLAGSISRADICRAVLAGPEQR